MIKKINIFFVLLLLTFLTAVSLRLYQFDKIPFGINHDGSLESLEAIELSQQPLPYQAHSIERPWLGETLFRYYLAIFIKIFGPNPWTVKLASTIVSILTIPFFYLLSKNLFGRKTALFSTLLLSLSGWQIIMGKTVWRAASLPLTEIIALYFLISALKNRSWVQAILAGIGVSLAVNTYAAGRIVPLIALLAVLLYFLHQNKNVSRYKKTVVVLFISFCISIFPLLTFAAKHPDIFNSRADYLYVGNLIKETKSLGPVLGNIKKTALMFNIRAGGDDFFVNEPLLDTPVNLLFVFGLLTSLFFIKKYPYQFLLLGFLLSLAPGLLSSPNGNRDIGSLPFVYLISGIGLYQTWKWLKLLFKNKPVIPNAIITLVCAWGLLTTWNLYFGPNRRELFGFYPETTVVGDYMKDKLNNYDFYLTDNYPRDALTFLTYQGGNPWTKHYTWLENKFSFLEVWPQTNKGTVFIMFKADSNWPIIRALQNKFPQGKLSELEYKDGLVAKPAAWIFTVEKN